MLPSPGELCSILMTSAWYCGMKHTDIFIWERRSPSNSVKSEDMSSRSLRSHHPKGLPHGPVTIRKVDRPIVHYSVGLAPDYKAEALPKIHCPQIAGTRYKHLIKSWASWKIFHHRPRWQEGQKKMGPGNADQIAWRLAKTLKGWRSTLAGDFTPSAANGTGTAKPIPTRKKKFWFCGLIPIISIIWLGNRDRSRLRI